MTPHEQTPDAELDALLSILKDETAQEPSAALQAAILAAVPRRASFSVSPFAALAACAVLGLAVGFGAARFTPSAEEQAMDAVIAVSLQEVGFDG